MSPAVAWGAGGLGALAAACLVGGAPPAKRLPTPIRGVAADPPPGAVPPGEPPDSPSRSGPRASAGRVSGSLAERPLKARLWHAVVLGLLLGLVAPALVPVPLAVIVVLARLEGRRRRRRHESAVIDQLPDLVDLLRLTTLAGLPVNAALGAIGDRPGGVVGGAIARSAQMLRRGAATSQALGTLSELCGPPARSLVDALADHDRYGTPLAPSLERVGIECRLRRRRRAEEAARRLPVALLFPLVLTTLPAFILLTVVPLLVGSFSSLQL